MDDLEPTATSNGDAALPDWARVDPSTEEDLIEFCHQHVGSYKKPAVLRFAPTLPRNGVGKLVRRELRQEFLTGAR